MVKHHKQFSTWLMYSTDDDTTSSSQVL